ncbi:MAG: hypothetical protein NC250_06180 [Alistipes senegalensis]|nr:hypothetical protein [Bacteroides cellulosilyticus]MCM1352302.1 hypothetical protein [Alistipes senegalensis]
MKRTSFLLWVCFAGLFPAVAQQPFICTEPGTTLEYACYDSKGVQTGYSRSMVEKCERNADDCLEVSIREEEFDLQHNPVAGKNGPEAMIARTVVRADDMLVPYGDLLASALQGKDWSLAMTESSEYAYPFALSVGMALPDVAAVFNVVLDGEPTKMNVLLNISDRRVLAHERITVPAGTFDAYGISETVSIKVSIFRVVVKNLSWVVPGIGSVRTEQQNKKGKIENYSELIAIRRPVAD